MAHIVCLTSGLTGILHASFELVSRLEAAGHRVTYGSPAVVMERVAAQGIAFVQLPPILQSPEPEVPVVAGPFKKGRRWWYKVRNARQRRRAALESIGADAIKRRLEEWSPDLLIIDVELHEYILMAFSMDLPLVLLSQWFSLWKRPGLPYLLHETIPGKGWSGHRMSIELSWWLVKAERQWMFARKKWMSGGTDRRSALLALARELKFPLAYIRENYWPGPFTYQTLPVISMTAWEMEFPHVKRDNLHYIGPMVYTQRKDTSINADLRAKLAQIFKQKEETGSALLYCSVSTLKNGDQHFLKKVCQAVGAEPGWILLLGMGGLLDTGFLDPLPINVHPFPWLPQLQVLAEADCSINHGGIHTINECIHFRVPMLVYSGKRSDQNGCAARVAYHHLGITADKDVDTVADIHRKITQILREESYRDKMAQMHQYYLRYQQEKKLENLISTLLEDV